MSATKLATIRSWTETYARACQIPALAHARICKQSNDGEIQQVQSIWSKKALQYGKAMKKQCIDTIKVMDGGDLELISSNTLPFINYDNSSDSQVFSTSFSGEKTATLITQKKANGDEKQFIMVYNNSSCTEEVSLEVSSLKKHGKIYPSGVFGALRWSKSENALLYVAEKQQDCRSYFDPTIDWNDEEKTGKLSIGDKFLEQECWGEQNAYVKNPVICVLNLKPNTIEVFDLAEMGAATFSPYKPVWGPDDQSIVFIGLDCEHFRLGKVFCSRHGRLCSFDLATKEFQFLDDVNFGTTTKTPISYEGLAFTMDDKNLMVFAREYDGPHLSAIALFQVDWKTKEQKAIIPIIESVFDKDEFPGLYDITIPQRCWTGNESQKNIFIFTSIIRSKSSIIAVDIDSGSYGRIESTKSEDDGCWTVLDASDQYILSTHSSPNQPPRLFLSAGINVYNQLTSQQIKGGRLCIDWTVLGVNSINRPESGIPLEWKILTLSRQGQTPYEAILITPKNHPPNDENEESKKFPLIVYVHGGPHSTSQTTWFYRDLFLVELGYAILKVNYHGSIGFGRQFVRSLPGQCGTLDVLDVHHAVTFALEEDERLDASKVMLYGGSHGGFIVTHLCGQFPNTYKACCAHNPVLDFVAMHSLTDITDWTIYESLGKFPIDYGKQLDNDEQALMFNASAVAHAEKITIPYLLLIGQKDLRVNPHYRGFLRCLQARNVKCKVLSYPESCHPLDEVDVESDWLLNMVRWFDEAK